MRKILFRLFVMILMLSTFHGIVNAKEFSDISNHKLKNAIQYIQTQGYVNGYDDGTYKGDILINRAEFTKIVVGAALDYDPGEDPSGFDIYSLSGLTFSDIEDGAWYNPYLRQAVEGNIIDGYPDGTFQPTNNINLAEALKIIINAYKIDISGYENDVWYEPFLNWAKEKGIVMNISNHPDHLVTRGEMAELIYQIEDFLNNPDRELPNITDTSLEIIKDEIVSEINKERNINNLPPLSLNAGLTEAAQNHAQDMNDNNYLSHDSLDGRSMVDRVEETSFPYSFLGENIAQGQTNATQVVIDWMNSPPHRANILNEKFDSVGIGYVDAQAPYWVVVFGN